MIYLMTISVAQVIPELRNVGKNTFVSKFKYCRCMCLNGLSENVKKLVRDKRSSGRDLNLLPV
jgi:hypothetical protein